MNYNKRTKTIIVLLMVMFAFSAIFSSCDSYNDEPEIRDRVGTKTEYVLPAGEYMSDSERNILKQRNQEYKDALGII